MSFFCHGDGAFLKLDQDGRITMTDFIREHTGITDEVAFVGRGLFFQMWEPAQLARYQADVRARLLKLRQASARSPESTGMMAGNSEDNLAVGGPARHIPVLLAEVLAALQPADRADRHRRHVRRGRLYARRSSTPAPSVIAIDRDPDAIEAGTRARSIVRWQAAPRACSVFHARPAWRAGRRRRARHRRLLHADRPGGARLFLSRRRPARHAHGADRHERGRRGQQLCQREIWPASSTSSARRGRPAASPA